ncbi:hypothetical protein JTB14_024904 [Gonioctena quinquepunctata]|nr:hypothetical protein JTB14_024904 [Gonioctena quinquepunctata]
MENYRQAQISLSELWQEIEKCHLSFLELEESPEKIDQRSKLEEYIHEFLCVVTNAQKFTFSETQEVLQRSAISKKDFSGYKATTGFNAIQLYAGNLLSQPWRREYRQIKTYCGFYKHQIEANLIGAMKMFEAMGYQQHSDQLLVLEGPICPDRVAAVSRDCLIAYVECQILKVIWEELSTSYKISWLEVLEFRKNHVCSPEESIKALKYKQQQRQYQQHTRSYSQGCEPMPSNRCLQLSNMSPLVVNHSFPPPNHVHVGLPPMQECQFGGGCCSNYSAFPPAYAYMTYAEASARPNLNTNGYYNGYATPQIQPGLPYAVPTAKLIEVESQSISCLDSLDKPPHKSRHSEFMNNELHKVKNSNDVKNHSTDDASDRNESQFEDWEYVYRNLESQGYSKDLGERGDLLSPNSLRQRREMKKLKATNLDEAFNDLTVNERTSKAQEIPKKITSDKNRNVELTKIDKQTSPSSSYDNLVSTQVVKKQTPKSSSIVNYVKKTLPRDKSSSQTEKPSTTKITETAKVKEDKTNRKKNNNKGIDESWHCKACTFLNNSVKDICEICGKSRSTTLEQPIEVGGAECSKCTLVNPKNKTLCEACGASLIGSPTYI